MERIIGYCGLICTDCPAYLAKRSDDKELRKKTAAEWSRIYGSDIKPGDINCDGCNTEGAKFNHCSQCEIRACGMGKDVKNCGHCNEYACTIISEFFQWVPEAKVVLDAENDGK